MSIIRWDRRHPELVRRIVWAHDELARCADRLVKLANGSSLERLCDAPGPHVSLRTLEARIAALVMEVQELELDAYFSRRRKELPDVTTHDLPHRDPVCGWSGLGR